MRIEELFDFIHGLSKTQKANFARFMSGKEETRSMLLYERIRKQRTKTENAIKKIQGEEFLDHQLFSNYRGKLLKAVLKSMVFYNHKAISVIPYVKTAYLMNANAEGKRVLFNEMARLEKKEAYVQLLALHELIEELNDFHGLKIKLPLDRLSTDDVVGRISKKRILIALIEKMRVAANRSEKIRFSTAQTVESELEAYYAARQNRDLALKIRMNVAFFKREYELAYAIGERLIQSIKKWEQRYPPSILAREVRFLAMNATLLNMRDRAVYYAMLLSNIQPATVHGAKEVSKSAIIVGAAVAAYFGEWRIGKKVYSDYQQLSDSISSKISCLVLNNIGRAYFFNEMYSDAEGIFQQVRNRIPNGADYLRWEPQLYLAICRFEQNKFETVENLIRSASRAVENGLRSFPKQATKTIREYCIKGKAPNSTTEETIIELLQDREEKQSSYNFPVEIWIHSKRSRLPLIEALHLKNDEGTKEKLFFDFG